MHGAAAGLDFDYVGNSGDGDGNVEGGQRHTTELIIGQKSVTNLTN